MNKEIILSELELESKERDEKLNIKMNINSNIDTNINTNTNTLVNTIIINESKALINNNASRNKMLLKRSTTLSPNEFAFIQKKNEMLSLMESFKPNNKLSIVRNNSSKNSENKIERRRSVANYNDIIKTTKNIISSTIKFNTYFSNNYENYTIKRKNSFSNNYDYPLIENIYNRNDSENIIVEQKTFNKRKFNRCESAINFLDKKALSSGFTNTNKEGKHTLTSFIAKDYTSSSSLNINNNIYNINRNIKKEYSYLINELIDDWKYNDKYYDENEIFFSPKNKNKYNAILKNKINNLRVKGGTVENKTTILQKIYNVDKDDDIYPENYILNKNIRKKSNKPPVHLELLPAQVIFTNLTDKNKENLKLEIPLSYMFVFYYNNFENLEFLLLSLIEFNSTFDKIELNEKRLINFIKKSSLFNSNEISPKKLNLDFFNNDIVNNNNNYIKKVNTFASSYTSGQFFSGKKEIGLEPKEDNKRQRLSFLKKGLINCMKYNKDYKHYNEINQFRAIWITPKYSYQVDINLPQIYFSLNNDLNSKCKYEVRINSYIHKDLFLFLFINNFVDWDFYIISYLISFKKIRIEIEKYLSKYKQNGNNIPNKELNKYNYYFNNQYNDNSYIDFTCFNQRHFDFVNSNNSFIHLFYTNSQKNNYLKVLKSLNIIASIKHKISSKELVENYSFDFNFNQLKVLNEVSKYQKLEKFINKLLFYDFENKKMEINYDVFNNLSSFLPIFKKNFEDEKVQTSNLFKKSTSKLIIDIINKSSDKSNLGNKNNNFLFSNIDNNKNKELINTNKNINMTNNNIFRKNTSLSNLTNISENDNKKVDKKNITSSKMWKKYESNIKIYTIQPSHKNYYFESTGYITDKEEQLIDKIKFSQILKIKKCDYNNTCNLVISPLVDLDAKITKIINEKNDIIELGKFYIDEDKINEGYTTSKLFNDLGKYSQNKNH